MRYRVTGDSVAPSGASGRWEFPVEWHAYAATGTGCEGAVGPGTVLHVDEAAPTVISTTEITSLVRQGPFQIAPDGWTGEIEQEVHYPEPPSGASGTSAAETSTITTSVAEARRLFRYWRDPALPASWAFGWAIQDPSGIRGPFPDGHCANYYTAEGYLAVRICIGYLTQRPFYGRLWWTGGILAFDLHMIDGHDVFVAYSPPGPAHERKICLQVWLFDKRSGLLYTVSGHNTSLCGDNVEAAIAIARSLPPPNAAP